MAKIRVFRINGYPAISAVSSSVRLQGEIETCSKDDPVQGSKPFSALAQFDTNFPRLRRRGKA
jgi:hypothetical protein